MDFKKIFAERLLKLRLESGISQDALGKEFKISGQAMSLLEKGKRCPSFEVLIALAEFFNVSIDYLVGRSDDPTRR